MTVTGLDRGILLSDLLSALESTHHTRLICSCGKHRATFRQPGNVCERRPKIPLVLGYASLCSMPQRPLCLLPDLAWEGSFKLSLDLLQKVCTCPLITSVLTLVLLTYTSHLPLSTEQ